jgi:putative DNA methylase
VPEEFPTDEAQENERLRLFALISELVTWENTTNEQVLNRAREEIKRSWRRACTDNADHPEAAELFDPNKLPGFHDPFAGGGALPLEAQRLGLEAYASDLNPVAVLINKAMIEIPPKFAGLLPVNPESRRNLDVRQWKGAQGLAEDVRYYGQWMRDEAEKRIGHLYPKVEVTAAMAKDRTDLNPYVGKKLTVIAWIWARTVKSPNPAFAQVDVPLASTFMLSTKVGKEAYVEPVVEGGGYHFTVKVGRPKNVEAAKSGTSAGKRAAFRCLTSDTPLTYDYIRSEGKSGRMGERLMAILAEGNRERVYLAPMPEMEAIALNAQPTWRPETPLPDNPRDFKTPNYGLSTYGDIFTARQLVALTTFSELVEQVRKLVRADALAAGLPNNDKPLREQGRGEISYAEALGTYLSLAVDKTADYSTSLAAWQPDYKNQRVGHLFSRQAIPMCWDFGESNLLGETTANFPDTCKYIALALEGLPCNVLTSTRGASAVQESAAELTIPARIVSTDPPYYDNIGYADLSDFFYIWLRRSLKTVFPELFATLAVPKAEELVATPYRHGGK